MLSGIHKYLVDNGFRRTKWEYKTGEVVDNESMNISTYGPVWYQYKRGNTVIIWGLGVQAKKTPYFYLPGLEEVELTLKIIER